METHLRGHRRPQRWAVDRVPRPLLGWDPAASGGLSAESMCTAVFYEPNLFTVLICVRAHTCIGACMCTGVRVCVCRCMCQHACGIQSLTLSVFLHLSPP